MMPKKRTIVARLLAGRCKFRILSRDKKFFSSPERPDGLVDPPRLLFSGYRRPELEYDHSSPSNAES